MAWNRRAMTVAAGLSLSLTVSITCPASGRPLPAEICALANAVPNASAMPITSPVERISGPRIGSNSRNLANGKTASFTATYGAMTSAVKPMSLSFSPSMTRAASDASGTPMVLETNGMVRDARGLTSST